MANYSDIKGFTVQTLSSDTATSQASTGSWASGTSLNTARHSMGGAGTQTNGIVFGGQSPPPVLANTESYNGSSWTEVADLNTARSTLAGAGAYNSAVAMGGATPSYVANAETWNGSSWTAISNINTARGDLQGGAGASSTSSLLAGGANPGGSTVALTEIWDGSSWTEVGDLNTGRRDPVVTGIATSAIASGGLAPGGTANNSVEQWNGSSWTEIVNINTARGLMSGVSADSTSQLVFGGYPEVAKTEFFDGSSWTELADLGTARQSMGELGSTTLALAAGGSPGAKSNVEEWSTTPASEFSKITEGQLYFNSTANAFKETVTDLPGGSWASGASINDGRNASGSAGTTTAALLFTGDPVSGSPTGISANTEKYDGSSWTEVNNTNTARRECFYGCGLTNTAALCVGGYDGSAKTSNVETWDGTNWTETTNLNQTRNSGALVGSSTAAIGFGGIEPPFTGKTEFWNGSTWTELADLNTSRYVISGAGPSYTAALAFGGYSTSYDAETEEWNGTSWTEVSDLNTARYGIGATVSSSSLNSILAFGGDEAPPANNKTEFWNGSSWSELAEISTARFQGGSTGTSGTGALFFGGAPNPVATSTEEWTVNLANKTITAS